MQITADLLQEVLPSYLLILFTPNSLYILFLCFVFIITLFSILQLIKVKRFLGQKCTYLEIKPSYKSLQSGFSTKQLFTILYSIHKPASFWDKFLGIKKAVSCELISSKEDGIRYILRVPSEDVGLVKKSLIAYLPAVDISEIEDYLPSNTDNVVLRELKLSKPFVFPLQEQTTLDEYDPIAYLTNQMTQLQENELLSLQIIVSPVFQTSHSGILEYTHKLKKKIANNDDITNDIEKDILGKVIDSILSSKKKRLSDLSNSKRTAFKVVEDKITEPLFETSLRLLAVSNTKGTAQKRIKGMLASFETFTSPYQSLKLKVNPLTYVKSSLLDKLKYYFFNQRLLSFISNPLLSASELASIYHFPYTSTTKTEDLVKSKSPKLPAPLSFKKSHPDLDTVFANNIFGENVTPIGLTLEERRRHIYIIGATGTGKTTLLMQMIYQDMLGGKGLAIVDPHGDLADHLLSVVPKERINDVVYFNPYDIELPIGLNLLELSEGLSEVEKQREKDLITSSLVSVFHKLYPARYSGPRMEHVLRNTVLTALETEKPTLLTIYKLLTDKKYRDKIVGNLQDQLLKDFWKQEFGKLGSYQKAEMISPITYKLGRFLTTSLTRNILIQEKSKLNFENITNTQKILICDLSKGKIGEDVSSFLGSLLIAKLQLAALNRVHTPQEQRQDFFLYIDEFQNFATTSFAEILSEARKYRLNAILAHQTISQIENKDLLKVILANVGTVISFRTSNPSDESFILPLFTPQVEKNEISNLPSYSFYIKINALSPQDAFTASTTNFEVKKDPLVREQVIAHSQKNFGMMRPQIEVEVTKPINKTVQKKEKVVSKSNNFFDQIKS